MPDLTLTYRGVVYPWQLDHMGHMNVTFYMARFDEATWNLFAELGLTPTFFRENRRGMAAVQQEISYKRELYGGDIVAVYSGVLEMKEKAVRFYHELRNMETGEVAATTILTAVHLDTQTRRAIPFTPEIAERGRACTVQLDGSAPPGS
jgi:acyl-CoA thioester hydrolase